MARRMISSHVYETDAFMLMPMKAQALYTHILLRADDDGFFGNVIMLMRMLDLDNEALDVLLEKRFLLMFDSGVVVVKHFFMQNTIRKDRYKPTTYQNEYSQIMKKDNGSYTEIKGKYKGYKIPKKEPLKTKGLQVGTTMETKEQPSGNQMATKEQPDGNVIQSNLIQSNLIQYKDNTLSSKNFDDIEKTPLEIENEEHNVMHNDTITLPNATTIVDVKNSKPKNNNVLEAIKEIVEFLNQKLGTSYRYTTKKTQDLIKARMNEGFVLNDFFTVIDKKVREWKKTEWEKFLRPETLFSNKFEGYLQQPFKENKDDKLQQAFDRFLNNENGNNNNKRNEVIIDVE